MSAVGGDQQGRITGRGFASRQDDAFRALNDSIGFDWRLAPYDVDQSIAHATMLGEREIISEPDRDELIRGLEQVRDELRDGAFPFADDDEDIHMAIERRLTEIVGPVGGRLHTARSRNDQVATDVAMFVHAHAQDARDRIQRLARTLIVAAERHLDWPMPGYTHLQRAQPVYLSHHLLAYVWMLVRDRERFAAVVAACCAAAARRGRAGRRQLRHRSPGGRRGARFHRRGRELDRRRLQP